VNASLGWPNGLCIDYSGDVLYWADAKLDRVEMSDIHGHHRRVLVTGVQHPFGLAVVIKANFHGSGFLVTASWQVRNLSLTSSYITRHAPAHLDTSRWSESR